MRKAGRRGRKEVEDRVGVREEEREEKEGEGGG